MIGFSDADEVRAYHRALSRRPAGTGLAVSAVAPWDSRLLVPSLRSLAEQGYTLDDIGVMLGISKERVRQLYRRHEI